MKAREYIKGFQPISLCDWPSRVSCVIFMGGCNFRCPTCHNKKIAFTPEKVQTIPIEEIFDYLKHRRGWIDGVVVSGGEPTLVQELDGLLKEIKLLGYGVKLDTNGSNPEIIEDLLIRELVDLFAVDVKGPFEKYSDLTGIKLSKKEVEKKFKKIFSLASLHPSKFLFRLTKVPILKKEDILKTKNYLPPGFELNLQEYMEVT